MVTMNVRGVKMQKKQQRVVCGKMAQARNAVVQKKRVVAVAAEKKSVNTSAAAAAAANAKPSVVTRASAVEAAVDVSQEVIDKSINAIRFLAIDGVEKARYRHFSRLCP